MAVALDFLHNPGVDLKPLIHLNLSSSNVLLTADLDVKISDFGLSQAFHMEDAIRKFATEHTRQLLCILDFLNGEQTNP